MKNHNYSLAFIICYLLCSSLKGQQRQRTNVDSEPISAKELSNKYCATCHKFPKPELLDKKTWKNNVLPNMALRLGLRMAGKYEVNTQDTIEASLLKQYNTYPETALISKEDWSTIEEYYIENAPENLKPNLNSLSISKNEFPFEVQSINIDDVKLPQVTLLKYDHNSSELYVGNYLKLFALRNDGEISREWDLDSYASDIEFTEGSDSRLLTIGKLTPSNQRLGQLYQLNANQETIKLPTSFTDLRRPVSFKSVDLNLDGKKDLIICSFGHTVGKLSWYDDYDFSKEFVLSDLPGTRKVEINDFNHDGRPDIMALTTQAYEGIKIFYNQGGNSFREEEVLEFPPVHGLSYFELADFNSDGHQDILVTNGDNRDFSPIDKPYHGIRIYLNDTRNRFEEAYFYPMYDCNKAMARDFDNDGDLDIISASLFVDYQGSSNVKDGIVFLTNDGKLNFQTSFLPNPTHANWLTMDVADFNKDGLLDVILGGFVYDVEELFNIISATGISNPPQILLLTQKR